MAFRGVMLQRPTCSKCRPAPEVDRGQLDVRRVSMDNPVGAQRLAIVEAIFFDEVSRKELRMDQTYNASIELM